ncbi:hypothetical protein GCM10027594_23950 [Hymenobacter agri]
MTDANAQLQALFNSHGIDTIPLEKKFMLVSKQLALVESRITYQEFPNNISSQLDVSIIINKRVIIECFGDVSDTLESAVEYNLRNFAKNSLHVIIGALQDLSKNEQLNIAQWVINGHSWKIYHSNYGIKAAGNKPVYIPAELFNRIETIISSLALTEEYHWFRFFFCCSNSKIYATEFLYDNENFSEAEQDLLNLDWELTPEYYSIRLFLILRRVHRA